MNLDTTSQKVAIVNKLTKLNEFIADNQQHVNPDKLADLILKADRLTEKVKAIFREEENLDEALQKYTDEVDRQKNLIADQELLLSATENELLEREPDDEYQGVIARDV